MYFVLFLLLVHSGSLKKIDVYRQSDTVYCDIVAEGLLDETSQKHLRNGSLILLNVEIRLEREDGTPVRSLCDTIRLQFDIWNEAYVWQHSTETERFKSKDRLAEKVANLSHIPVAETKNLAQQGKYRVRAAVTVRQLANTPDHGANRSDKNFLKTGLHAIVGFFFGWLDSSDELQWQSGDVFTPGTLVERP